MVKPTCFEDLKHHRDERLEELKALMEAQDQKYLKERLDWNKQAFGVEEVSETIVIKTLKPNQ